MRLLVNGRPLTFPDDGICEHLPVSWCAAFVTHLAREVFDRGRDGRRVIDVEEAPPPGALVRRPR